MFSLVLNPWVLSAFFAAFLASLAWIAAMTKLPISQAYPLNAMTFILVVICGGAFFSEPFGLHKVLGLILIVLGILIASQGPV
jgi:drug/metabolite transporter (DMT)-like permease